jgi:DNA-binding NarL/FixJ family response regulator
VAGGDAADAKPYVLVVSGSESDDEVLACVRSGARGYVSTTAGFPVLLLAVHLIALGGAGFNASAATRLSALTWKDSATSSRGTLAELTKREREVLELLAQGYNNRRIARELFLSERTVRNHLTRVFLKLGVRDRLHAAIVARNSLPSPA